MADMFQQIAANKRKSIILVFLMTLLVVAVGAVIGAVWFHWVYGVAFAVVLAVLMSAFAYWGGAGTILAMSGAREMKKRDDPQLFNVVEEMTIASGMPMPKIYLIQESAPNAFATGRDPEHASVAITRGLREKLNRDELQGVMAHELSHIRHYDIRLMMMIVVLVGVIVLLCDWFWRMAFYSRWGGSRSRDNRGEAGARLLLIVVAVVLAILAPMMALLIQAAISRQREYLADAGAAEMTRYPPGLASALLKISGDPDKLHAASRATQHLYIVNPLKSLSSGSSLMNTHPPIGERVQRLRAMGGATTA